MIIPEEHLEKIRETVSFHRKLLYGQDMTDNEWEDYVFEEYAPMGLFQVDEDNFFTYLRHKDYIWIQDFVSSNPKKALKMLEEIESFENVVKCQVAVTNISILNIIIRKGFRIKDLKGYNYILERSGNYGR